MDEDERKDFQRPNLQEKEERTKKKCIMTNLYSRLGANPLVSVCPVQSVHAFRCYMYANGAQAWLLDVHCPYKNSISTRKQSSTLGLFVKRGSTFQPIHIMNKQDPSF